VGERQSTAGGRISIHADGVAEACGPRKKHRILAKTIAGTIKTTKRPVAMLQVLRRGARDTMVRVLGEDARAMISSKVPMSAQVVIKTL
jgi:hypothetical protein